VRGSSPDAALYWMVRMLDGGADALYVGRRLVRMAMEDVGLADPRALRYLYLTAHYSQPMNFTWEAAQAANTALNRLTKVYYESKNSRSDLLDEAFLKEFYSAIANDLDTPKALAMIWENIKTLNKATLAEADKILGLGLAEVRPSQKIAVKKEIPAEVQKWVAEREEARAAKAFARSDALRTQIEAAGFEVKDTPEGPSLIPFLST